MDDAADRFGHRERILVSRIKNIASHQRTADVRSRVQRRRHLIQKWRGISGRLAAEQQNRQRRGARDHVDLDTYQSNHEGAIIDRLHARDFDAVLLNAGGLTHTSVALRDALLAIERPFWEVHLSDPWQRDTFRRVNFLHDVAAGTFKGLGARGYHLALEAAVRHLESEG